MKEEPVVEHQDDDDDWVDDSPEKPVGRSLLARGEQGKDQGADGARTLHSLNPYTRPLTISDLDSCIALENAAFEDPGERCSPEKVCCNFPFSTCLLCLGMISHRENFNSLAAFGCALVQEYAVVHEHTEFNQASYRY